MADSFFDLVFELLEEGNDLLLEVAVPGVLETDIDVTLEGVRLIIRAERPLPVGPFIHREIKRGILIRDIILPCPVELCESRFEDGLLRLHLKRMEEQ